MGCTTNRTGEIGKSGETYYVCKSSNWQVAKKIEYDTYQWAAGEDGDIKRGNFTDVQYKYDESLDQWVEANENDVSVGFGCTTNRTGEIGKSGETYYVCKNSNWRVAAEIDYDTYGEKCTSAEVGKTMNGKETATNKYYCSSKGWVSLMGGWSWGFPKEARLNPEIAYGTMTDTRDNKTYKTVKIGDQVWMAENLNYADSTKMPSLKGKSWCYDNKTENCDVTGRLYTWAAAIDSVALANDADNPQTCGYGETCTLPTVVQGVCPSGWHLPTYDEWQTLFKAVGGSSAAGKALKSGSGWSGNGNGTDTYGFSALPAGYRRSNGNFNGAGYDAIFWSAPPYEGNGGGANGVYLYYVNESADMYYCDTDYGYSVRCLQN
nr:fibrobacter succinogenes major paralogous domain-containing protein [Fibrobacter succinogenes]